MNISTFVRNLIKRGVVSKQTNDAGPFAVAQVTWGSDKVGNVEVVHPYGFVSCAPVGSVALMFNVFGQEENRAAILSNSKARLRGLKPGEAGMGNFIAKSYIIFKRNGDINIVGSKDQNITIEGDSNITINGNATMTVGGDLTANVTGNTDITSPFVTVNGALRATGEITAFYGLPGATTFTDIITKYNAHTHTSAAPGSPTGPTLPPNTLP